MKQLFLVFCLFSVLSGLSQTQHVSDTILLQEIKVSEQFVLGENASVNLFRHTNSSSIDQVTDRLGNVVLISRGAYAKEPLINSFSGGQLNITIDGMKIFGACTDKMDPVSSYVEPINLRAIEIQHGSTGAANGSTVGGTLNMRLQKPRLNTIDWELGSKYESSANGKNAFLRANYGSKKWAYRLSGTYRNYDTYRDGEQQSLAFSQFEKWNLHQSLLFVPAKGHEIKLDALIDDAYDVGYPALPMDVGKAQGRLFALNYTKKSTNARLQKLRIKLYANTIFHLMDDSQRDSLYMVKNSRTEQEDSVYMRMDMPGWSDTYGSFVEAELKLSAKNRLHLKLESYLNKSKAEMTMFMNNLSHPNEPPMYAETWPEHQRWSSGIYLQDRLLLNAHHQLVADLRVDLNRSEILSQTGVLQFQGLGYDIAAPQIQFNKSANIYYTFRPQNAYKIQAGIGYGERMPTLTEQFGFYLFNALDAYDYVGNPFLETEKSANAWLKFNYSGKKIQVNSTIQFNQMYDYILGENNGKYSALNLYASGAKQYINLPSAQVWAANLQFRWKPFQRTEFFHTLKFNHAQDNNKLPLPLIAPLKQLSVLAYKAPQYFCQLELEQAAAQKRIRTSFGETNSQAYALVNLRAGYDLLWKQSKLKINIGVENLFDTAYSDHLDWGDYNRPGRNFFLAVVYQMSH